MVGSWKSLIIPPLVALFIFLLSAYVIAPLYRQRARYANYIPISISLSSSGSHQSRFSRIQGRILEAFSPFRNRMRRVSTASDDMFGDEELEEGVGGQGEIERARINTDGERRLSRELEVGFMDDSDEEDNITRSAR
ncbi:MAG: hypothetical protein MMC33_009268 [Icmadophila ericetorum]|nr:hypothetical protein [Icmadophila ericetorum]